MSQTQSSLQIPDLHYLQDQYPLIHQITKQLNLQVTSKLSNLVQLAKYNVPKQFYSDDVKELDDQIQEICIRYNERKKGEELAILIPEEMRKNQSVVSDEEEAKETLQRKYSLTCSQAKKLSICEIQRMIENFKLASDIQLVSPEIIRALNEFSTCKKQIGVIQKGDLKQKPQWKKTISKAYSAKSKDSTPVSIQKKQKTDIIITIGNNVPIEVRQMRNNVKVKSQNSFAITSQVEQGKKTDIQKEKVHISLSLNKVSEENAQEIFQELKELVIKSEELGVYFVQELLKKCLNEFKMIQNYLNFFCLFTKISEKAFEWRWGNSHSNKITCIHRILIEKLQNVFSETIESKTETKKLKFIGKIIGTLINKKKISKQIYLKVNNTVLSKLLILRKENQCDIYENYFECQIELIDSMKNTFDKVWQENKILESLSPNVILQLKQKCNVNKSFTMEEVLVELQKISQFPTARINCLISNLFQRRTKETKITDKFQQKYENKEPKQNFANHAKSLLEKDDGIRLCLQYFEMNSSFDVLNEVILKICGGKNTEIESKVKQFIESSKISKQTLSAYWEEQHINFVFQECDFPFMTSVLAIIFVDSFNQSAPDMVIQVSDDHEDFEDIEYFMSKLEKKIDHYIESGETAVYH